MVGPAVGLGNDVAVGGVLGLEPRTEAKATPDVAGCWLGLAGNDNVIS